jgi:glycolate oxidase iron-sulfur subunit
MQTRFTAEQLADPVIADSERNLRACVHCGFCLSTCPTYTLLGDELDSPRGRIYLIKDMLEHDRPATAEVALHVDRCLSCLACQTTCPSGVNYQHLIDHARAHVEKTYRRPLSDRLLRSVLAWLLPYPKRFRLALRAARLARPFGRFMNGRVGAMLALAPKHLPPQEPDGEIYAAIGARRARVALLTGCAQRVIAPSINAATIRLLTRHGIEVVVPRPAGCCGAIVHHIGKADQARDLAVEAMRTWNDEITARGLDAIIVNTSGCGTEIKDYGHSFRDDPVWAEPARRISGLTRDISEFMAGIGIEPSSNSPISGLTVAYHAACSLQHGQRITAEPKALLTKAGFAVRDVPEGHLCCGSAGPYNLLQPEIAGRLRERKLSNIARLDPDIIATGNIGCITQLAGGTQVPVIHTVELIDWATGGPRPMGLAGLK